MADLIITAREHVDEKRVAVSARTPDGETVKVVMLASKVDTADMWLILRLAAAETDYRAAVLAARKGRTDSEET